MRILKPITTIFAFLYSLSSYAQETYTLFAENNLVGLKNQYGKIVIPAKYNSINNYTTAGEKTISYKGLFTAKQAEKDGKIKGGIINTNGDIIVPFNYRYFTRFSDDLAIGVSDKQLNIINSNGKIINTIDYKVKEPVVRGFSHGIAVANGFYESGKLTVFNKEKIISTFKTKTSFDLKAISPELIIMRDGHKGYNQYYSIYTIYGKRLTEDMFNFVRTPNKYGLMKASKGWASAEKHGYLDKDGKEAIPFVHNSSLSEINSNGIFSSEGSLYNLKNEIVRKVHKDTTFFAIADSKYSAYQTWRWLELYGLVNENYNIITPRIFIWKYLDFSNEDRVYYKINKKVFEIGASGKITPDNGSLEYENAIALMPNPKAGQSTAGWELPNTYLKLSIEKNYAPAQKILDSLYADAYYVKLNPQVKNTYLSNLEKYALEGKIQAMIDLADAYMKGTAPYQKNTEQGIKWYNEAIKKNSPHATKVLTEYYIALYDETNAKQTLNRFKGDKNHYQYNLKEFYQPGEVERLIAHAYLNDKNPEKTIQYFNKAITGGNAKAHENLANFYFGNKQTDKALATLNQGLQIGNISCMLKLGRYYGIYGDDIATINKSKSNTYYNMVLQSPNATVGDRSNARGGIEDNKQSEPLAVGTIVNIAGVKKVIMYRDANTFRTNDNQVYSSPASNYQDYKRFNVSGKAEIVNCDKCKGAGKITYNRDTQIYKNNSSRDRDGKLQSLLAKETITLKETESCKSCAGNGRIYKF